MSSTDRNAWAILTDVTVAVLPVALGAMLSFAAWSTVSLITLRASALTASDARQVTDDAAAYTDSRYDVLLVEITRLRDRVEELQQQTAETLAIVRLLQSNLANQPSGGPEHPSGDCTSPG